MSANRSIALAVLAVSASLASAQFSTLFTGQQDGVDLDIPFVGSSGLPPFNGPPFDVDGGSIVNTNASFILGKPQDKSGGLRVAFGGDGMATHFGVGELYRFRQGARNNWSVRGKGVGEIKFSPAAQHVVIFARGTNATLTSPPEADIDQDGTVDFRGFGKLQDAGAQLSVFDSNGDVIATEKVSNLEYQGFIFTGDVARIELTNLVNATSKNAFAIIGEVRAKPAGSCDADLDADGDADADDFFLFLDAFNAEDMSVCDLDADDDCDADDFFAYLDRFSLGC